MIMSERVSSSSHIATGTIIAGVIVSVFAAVAVLVLLVRAYTLCGAEIQIRLKQRARLQRTADELQQMLLSSQQTGVDIFPHHIIFLSISPHLSLYFSISRSPFHSCDIFFFFSTIHSL